jgi:DtxR family Mn-dependent transcriptional regulator
MGGRRASKMGEDYLKIIWKAQEWPGSSVSTNEIAETLAVTPSSVSANLKKLARDGLIDYEPYGRIGLTPAGHEIAVMVVRRHRVLETYLVECLGLGWDEVHVEAHALEHAVSDLVLDRMDEVLGHPARDPHGDPIPRADGSIERSVERNSAARLSEIDPGTHGRVIRISDHEPAILQYLEARQINIGTHIHLDERNPAVGSVLISRSSVAGEHADRVQQLLDWAGTLRRVLTFGIEGTGSYRATLTSSLRRSGHRVVEQQGVKVHSALTLMMKVSRRRV